MSDFAAQIAERDARIAELTRELQDARVCKCVENNRRMNEYKRRAESAEARLAEVLS